VSGISLEKLEHEEHEEGTKNTKNTKNDRNVNPDKACIEDAKFLEMPTTRRGPAPRGLTTSGPAWRGRQIVPLAHQQPSGRQTANGRV